MPFPRSDSERFSLQDAAQRAVESHDKPTEMLDPETRKMREEEHSGIELTGAELAYLKEIVLEKMEEVEDRIRMLERSTKERTASNSYKTENDKDALEKELVFLRHNLAEKLLGDTNAEGNGPNR